VNEEALNKSGGVEAVLKLMSPSGVKNHEKKRKLLSQTYFKKGGRVKKKEDKGRSPYQRRGKNPNLSLRVWELNGLARKG